MNFRPFIKHSAIFYVILRSIKNVFFLFLFLCVSFSQPQPSFLGDLNQNGIVHIDDLIYLVNMINNENILIDEYEQWSADVNFDNIINIQDIIIIVGSILNGNAICESDYCVCYIDEAECCYCDDWFIWEVDIISTDSLQGGVIGAIEFFSDDNIWVGGEFFSEDFLQVQNLAQWTGNEWRYKSLNTEYINESGFQYSSPHPFKSIYGISEDDVWLRSFAAGWHHWDGENFSTGYNYGYSQCNRDIWASATDDVFFACSENRILHFNGEEFTLMYPNILPIEDPNADNSSHITGIHGLDSNHVWASFRETYSISIYHPSGVTFFNGEYWEPIFYSTIYTDNVYYDVWAYGDTVYIPSSKGLIKYCASTGDSVLVSNSNGYDNYVSTPRHSIDGFDYENIALISSEGRLLIYDGERWNYSKVIHEQFGLLMTLKLRYTQNRITIVGFYGTIPSHAIIFRGYKRNE